MAAGTGVLSRPSADFTLSSTSVTPISPPAFRLLGEDSPLFSTALPILAGSSEPDLALAQRAIEARRVSATGFDLSGTLPELGQWREGDARERYLFLGVEAVALYSYFRFRAQGQDRPNQALASASSADAAAQTWITEYMGRPIDVTLAELYGRDELDAGGLSADRVRPSWKASASGPRAGRRAQAPAPGDDRPAADAGSRFGVVASVADHVVGVVEALREVHLNNLRIGDGLNLKIRARTGHKSHLFAILTHRFH